MISFAEIIILGYLHKRYKNKKEGKMQETQGFTKTQLFYIKITAKLPKVGPVSLLIKRGICYSEVTKDLESTWR